MSDREKRLEAALQIVDRHMSGNDLYEGIWINYPDKPEQSPASVVREALADADAGGGDEPCVEKSHALERASRLAAPPQHREALEALERIKSRWVEACDGHEASLQAMRADVEAVRRALTAPPTVPEEAVKRVARLMREQAEWCKQKGITRDHGVWNIAANELDRSLAQHSEPGRIPEAEELASCFHATYECLAPQYGYETRQETREFDPDSNNGRLMIAVCRVIRERLAAPAPDADERERVMSDAIQEAIEHQDAQAVADEYAHSPRLEMAAEIVCLRTALEQAERQRDEAQKLLGEAYSRIRCEDEWDTMLCMNIDAHLRDTGE